MTERLQILLKFIDRFDDEVQGRRSQCLRVSAPSVALRSCWFLPFSETLVLCGET
jgi:hypothetical protein